MLMEGRGGCHGWARGWRCGEEGLAGGADGEAAAAIWKGKGGGVCGGVETGRGLRWGMDGWMDGWMWDEEMDGWICAMSSIHGTNVFTDQT